jgi:MFS family permease
MHIRRRLAEGWGNPVSPSHAARLVWFWLDGAFFNGYDMICTTYLAVYAATIGASSAQVGAMSSLGSLAAALLLLPGAMLVERYGHRQRTVLIIGLVARVIFLGVVGFPLFLSGQPLVFTIIACSVARDGLNLFGVPAWISLSADIVPAPKRGRYFGSRTFGSTLIGVISVLAAGSIITMIGVPHGYTVAFALAFLLGLASSFSFSRIQDPHPEPMPAPPAETKSGFSLRNFFSIPAFPAFCLTSALFNFSLNIAGPFFNIYLVQNLGATPAEVGELTIATSIMTLLTIGFWGRLSDRALTHRVAVITGLCIPALPLAWVFVTSPWQVLPINLVSGFLWAGYNLTIFNLLLAYTPDQDRARLSAIYQILVTLSLAGGSALGGWMAMQYTFRANFVWSAVGRFLAALLFLAFVPRRRQESSGESPGPAY